MRSTLLAIFAYLCTSNVTAAGFQKLTIPNAEQPDLTVGLWYPTDAPVPQTPNTEYGFAVALGTPMIGTNGGLIVMSHGFGGWYAGHADTAIALANAGYIVAAPTHTGNTWSDMSSSVPKWSLDRPQHISATLDYLLTNTPTATLVNTDNIGVYGFSAGGYTALGLIGGIPDFKLAQSHCRKHPAEFACSEGLIDAMLAVRMDTLPKSAWGADDRIQAASIAAPGWAFAYPISSLTDVNADVQLWSGMLDESVPTNTNAAFLATQLPVEPETNWIDNASHFAFLNVPCTDSFKRSEPEEYTAICTDAPGFDRDAFHTAMNAEMVRFFNASFDINK